MKDNILIFKFDFKSIYSNIKSKLTKGTMFNDNLLYSKFV